MRAPGSGGVAHSSFLCLSGAVLQGLGTPSNFKKLPHVSPVTPTSRASLGTPTRANVGHQGIRRTSRNYPTLANCGKCGLPPRFPHQSFLLSRVAFLQPRCTARHHADKARAGFAERPGTRDEVETGSKRWTSRELPHVSQKRANVGHQAQDVLEAQGSGSPELKESQ